MQCLNGLQIQSDDLEQRPGGPGGLRAEPVTSRSEGRVTNKPGIIRNRPELAGFVPRRGSPGGLNYRDIISRMVSRLRGGPSRVTPIAPRPGNPAISAGYLAGFSATWRSPRRIPTFCRDYCRDSRYPLREGREFRQSVGTTVGMRCHGRTTSYRVAGPRPTRRSSPESRSAFKTRWAFRSSKPISFISTGLVTDSRPTMNCHDACSSAFRWSSTSGLKSRMAPAALR